MAADDSLTLLPDSLPYCIHGIFKLYIQLLLRAVTGPTLLFQRFHSKTSQQREFYACAVYRTRKGCQFFHWADEPLSETKRQEYMSRYSEHQSSLMKRTRPLHVRKYCTDCDVLVGDESRDESHDDHSLRDVSEKDLSQPTRLIYPVNDSKGQAVRCVLFCLIFALAILFFREISKFVIF